VAIPLFQNVCDERPVRGGRRFTLTFRDLNEVPAVLLLPTPGVAPATAALLLHGYSSRKEDMADTIGRALLTHGVASLALDLPLHGERSEWPTAMSPREAVDVVRQWRAAVDEATQGLRYLAARPEVDESRVALVGYSLGSLLGLAVAAADPSVAAVVLAASGDLPTGTPFEAVVRRLVDPHAAIQRLAGRPLLMINGRRDRTVRADQAEGLYAAAGEPKEIRWYDGGHWLPPQAVQYGAEWLAARLGEMGRVN
jgi:uncharacterized protein